MSHESSDELRQKILGRRPDWIKKFDAVEYEGNRPMIEKLYEEKQIALTRLYDVEDELDRTKVELADLSLKAQRLEIRLVDSKRQSWTHFVLSLVALVFVGFGIEIVASEPSHWSGWVLVCGAVILELLVFVLSLRSAGGQ
jgi:hypothetical protein